MTAATFTTEPVELGQGYSVAFRLAGARMDVEWTPDMPPIEVGQALLPAYGKVRNAFLAAVGEHLGVTIAVVELPAGGANG